MKVHKMLKKLFKIYVQYGNIEVFLPQVTVENGEEREWLAHITSVEVDDEKNVVEVY
jgi:hypothetical protein